jgi:hypothetical protein
MPPGYTPRTIVPITIRKGEGQEQEWKIWWPLDTPLAAIINTVQDLTHHYAFESQLMWQGRNLFADLSAQAQRVGLWHMGIQRGPVLLTLVGDSMIYNVTIRFAEDNKTFKLRLPGSMQVSQLVRPGGVLATSWGLLTLGETRLTVGEREIWSSRWEKDLRVRVAQRRIRDIANEGEERTLLIVGLRLLDFGK